MKLCVRLFDGNQENFVKFKAARSVISVKLFDGHQEHKVRLIDSESVLPVILRELQIVSYADGEPYEGEYEVIPSFELQTLLTAHKYMAHNVNVQAIEVSEVSNPSGGKTVFIGGIF